MLEKCHIQVNVLSCKTTAIVAQGSDESRLPAEHYFEEVMRGARVIESQCSKNVTFK